MAMTVAEALDVMEALVRESGEPSRAHRALGTLRRVAYAQGVPALVTHFEACQLLDVASGNLDRVAGLPEPVQVLGSVRRPVRLWRRDEMERFAEEFKARRGPA